jgi:hypothetical protein
MPRADLKFWRGLQLYANWNAGASASTAAVLWTVMMTAKTDTAPGHRFLLGFQELA